MKHCVLGIGAVGSILGAHLAAAYEGVSLLETGPQRDAIRANGLKLVTPAGATIHVHPPCVTEAGELGPQDVVFVCVKAYSLPAVADSLGPLLGEATRVVFVQNGIPWWYFHGLEGSWQGRSLHCLDPEGRIAAGFDMRRTIGCVTYVAAHVVEPGVVHHTLHDRFVVGEPAGPVSEDCTRIADVITGSGLVGKASADIRDEIWLKLWGNLALNPISALTGGTMGGMCADVDTRSLVKTIMGEAREVGRRLGIHFPIDRDTRITNAESLKGFKTSMLQDLEAGRPLEIDAIIGAVAEMARLVDVAVPSIDAVLALVRYRARLAAS